MASIFTFDPDPPRVASPWNNSGTSTPELRSLDTSKLPNERKNLRHGSLVTQLADSSNETVTRLVPEPQDGPVEYKLHLLLRPRRSFHSSSTAERVAGSTRMGAVGAAGQRGSTAQLSQTPPLASSSQSRQHRLEQLTTQLLWRLQQSSPYHASGPKHVALPSTLRMLPGSSTSIVSERIPHGLEESRGALYEIGVADDGTFVGLLQDELDESLHNLRAMAATLGCSVEITRKVAVGESEWSEDPSASGAPSILHRDRLWVAEAFIKPDMNGSSRRHSSSSHPQSKLDMSAPVEQAKASEAEESCVEQLRVTLTGATMSGKSSLLGILTSGALDNGRGKSRLGLLRHRHEIVSGMTSSVTQELLGYASPDKPSESLPTSIVNYASNDVASWPDIHGLCGKGRLAFFSDSAGHPRYRRTTVRGLVGWAPHWTLLCIPADSVDDTTGLSGSTPPAKDLLGRGTADIDLTDAHLQICLALQLPLLIAITKLDLASKSGLRQLLGKLLTTLKAAGRRPILLRDSASTEVDHQNPKVAPEILSEVRAALPESTSHGLVVPIVCTSAVNGTGISKLHALLHELPIPRSFFGQSNVSASSSVDSTGIFHVEDVFGDRLGGGCDTDVVVVSGILCNGHIAIGDMLNLGPFSADQTVDEAETSPSLPPSSFEQNLGAPIGSLKGALPTSSEWRKVRVVSLRNLRLPVHQLRADQVGTLGLQPIEPRTLQRSPIVRIRKGMVLSFLDLRACSIVEAEFPGISVRELSIGSMVVVYVASVRATAKVVLMSVGDEPSESSRAADAQLQFDLDDDNDLTASQILQASTIVHLRFVGSREYVAPGSKVFIMPGGGPGLVDSSVRGERGLAGLDGFVGTTLRVMDLQQDLHQRIDR